MRINDVLSEDVMRGFTLVEMVVVMMILAILAAEAGIRWNTRDTTAPYQAELLERNLRHAQMLAMTWDASLQVAVAGNGYSVACAAAVPAPPSPPCNNVGVVTDPATGKPFSETLQNGVTLTGGGIGFDRMGRPVNGVGTLFTVAQNLVVTAGPTTYTARVQPVTGFVSVTSP